MFILRFNEVYHIFQAFVRHQDREGKPFFTDNHEVNDLVRIKLLKKNLLDTEIIANVHMLNQNIEVIIIVIADG